MNLDSPGTSPKTTIQAPMPPRLTKKYLRGHLGIPLSDPRRKLFRFFEADGLFQLLPHLLTQWNQRRDFTPAESRVIIQIWKIEIA